jgi:hypothetical protein
MNNKKKRISQAQAGRWKMQSPRETTGQTIWTQGKETWGCSLETKIQRIYSCLKFVFNLKFYINLLSKWAVLFLILSDIMRQFGFPHCLWLLKDIENFTSIFKIPTCNIVIVPTGQPKYEIYTSILVYVNTNFILLLFDLVLVGCLFAIPGIEPRARKALYHLS